MEVELKDLPTRLADKFLVGDGCWEWTAAKNGGYGSVSDGTRVRPAHRAVYEMLVGPIPEGLELDHLCRNTSCVNPGHLEPVSRRENVLRGVSPAAQAASRTQCDQGHPFTAENTYRRRDGGGRRCRTCNANQKRGG